MVSLAGRRYVPPIGASAPVRGLGEARQEERVMFVETVSADAAAVRDEAAGEVSLKSLVAAYERKLITEALETTGWHQRRAAARLGLLPTTLLEKMKRLGIRRPLRDGRSLPERRPIA
jgi:transcriptional regulator with GAF, ATPase, and Fis domain